MEDVFRGVGIEVKLKNRDDFLIVMETLTRIGISSKRDNVLYQSCHIFHRQGRYAIVHFKEMFLLDGKAASISDNDLQRRNTIVKLLDDWGLVEVLDKGMLLNQEMSPIYQIKIIPAADKVKWELISKYNIGKKVTFN